MPEAYTLRKTVPTNTFVEMELDRYWVITRVGTNVAGGVILEVDGVPVVTIHGTLAPIARTNANLFGPLALGEHYIVVPPQRKLFARSATSGLVYLEGRIMRLAPGEAIPSEHLARYAAYASRKLEYYDYSVTVGTSWPAGREVEVAKIIPPTIEDHILKYIAGASVSGTAAAVTYGQIGIKLYYDGKPLDQLAAGVRYHGIDVLKMPLPPTSGAESEPFTFAELPVQVTGGHELRITATNISDSSISAASGQNIAVRFMALYERIIKA